MHSVGLERTTLTLVRTTFAYYSIHRTRGPYDDDVALTRDIDEYYTYGVVEVEHFALFSRESSRKYLFTLCLAPKSDLANTKKKR